VNDYDRVRRARQLVDEVDGQDNQHEELLETTRSLLNTLEIETAERTTYPIQRPSDDQ
jgi:hypothetical protein